MICDFFFYHVVQYNSDFTTFLTLCLVTGMQFMHYHLCPARKSSSSKHCIWKCHIAISAASPSIFRSSSSRCLLYAAPSSSSLTSLSSTGVTTTFLTTVLLTAVFWGQALGYGVWLFANFVSNSLS
jgi:hypothetical protein